MSTSTSAGDQRRPESNSESGLAALSILEKVKNLSTGAFHYEALDRSTSAPGANSSKSQLEDHHLVHCGCGPFPGSRTKQQGGGIRSKVSSSIRGGGLHETPLAGFLFGLLASYGRLRESVRTTNLNAYDLFVGSQMLFLMTASPIPRAKTPSPGRSRRLGILPMASFSSSSSQGQKMPDVRVKSCKSFPTGHCCESNAGRRLLSSRR